MSEFFDQNKGLLISFACVIICVLLLNFVKKKLIKGSLNIHQQDKLTREISGFVFGILQYCIVIVTVIIILKVNGYNVTSIVAGLGIFATIVGLALQDSIKDIINGIHIYMDNYYKVGDFVIYDNELCEVKYFSPNVTKFLVLRNQSTITVSNRNISKINKIKDRNELIYSFGFKIDKTQIDLCLNQVVSELMAANEFESIEYEGLVNVKLDMCEYRIVFFCKPDKIQHCQGLIHQKAYELLTKAGLAAGSKNG